MSNAMAAPPRRGGAADVAVSGQRIAARASSIQADLFAVIVASSSDSTFAGAGGNAAAPGRSTGYIQLVVGITACALGVAARQVNFFASS